MNLYGMVGNDAVGKWDYLGLQGTRCGKCLKNGKSKVEDEGFGMDDVLGGVYYLLDHPGRWTTFACYCEGTRRCCTPGRRGTSKSWTESCRIEEDTIWLNTTDWGDAINDILAGKKDGAFSGIPFGTDDANMVNRGQAERNAKKLADFVEKCKDLCSKKASAPSRNRNGRGTAGRAKRRAEFRNEVQRRRSKTRG